MANVFTSLSNTIWYTDKCSISTGSTPVTYQVYATALGAAPAEGNIYSGPPELGAYERKQIYVGVGNYITVTGSNFTAQEIGGQTSAQAGVGNFTEQLSTVEERLVELVASYDGVAFIPGITDYSDSAGTIPEQVGDQVAYVRCAAGSGKIAEFPSSHRPVLRQAANGSYYYDPNGVNCYGVTDCSGTGVANIYMCGAGAATGNGKVYAGCFKAPNNRMYMGVSDGITAGKIGAGVDGVSWNTLYANAVWSSATVVSVQRTADLATLNVNGETVDTAAISGVGSELPAYLMSLNNDGTAIDFWNNRWYGLVGILDTVSVADALTIETDFATIADSNPPYGSVSFDGNNYLSTTGGAGTAMGTGNFTWECWVRPTTSSGYQTFIDTRGIQTGYSGVNTDGAYFGLDTDTLYPVYYQDTALLVSSIAVTQDAWTHVALVRNSGTTTLYVGGVSGGTYSDSINFTAPYVDMGGTSFDSDLGLTGQISNLRMVKGTAVYTAPFTPPTAPLTAISGTQLLLNTPNDANFLEDSSTNDFTVTNNGAVARSALNPF